MPLVRGADAFGDEPRDVAEIGRETKIPGAGTQEESHRILRVVGNHEGFHADVADFTREVGREVRAHRWHMRCQLRRLGDQRRVEIADPPSLLRRERRDMAQQHPAVGVFPARVGIRKVRAEVAQRQSTQYRVADSVDQHIGIRMSVEAPIEGNRHAAEDELAPANERVNVETIPDADIHAGRSPVND